MAMIYATIVAPLILSRDAKPARAYKRLGWTMLIATVLWGFLLTRLYFVLN